MMFPHNIDSESLKNTTGTCESCLITHEFIRVKTEDYSSQ